jgi:hypothetical protein
MKAYLRQWIEAPAWKGPEVEALRRRAARQRNRQTPQTSRCVPAYGAFGDPTKWHDLFCVGGELCAVGDFNGDNRDDVIALVRNSQPGVPQGDVRVALSTGSKFLAAQKWNDWIASNGEELAIGDFNFDGRDDIACSSRTHSLNPPVGMSGCTFLQASTSALPRSGMSSCASGSRSVPPVISTRTAVTTLLLSCGTPRPSRAAETCFQPPAKME